MRRTLFIVCVCDALSVLHAYTWYFHGISIAQTITREHLRHSCQPRRPVVFAEPHVLGVFALHIVFYAMQITPSMLLCIIIIVVFAEQHVHGVSVSHMYFHAMLYENTIDAVSHAMNRRPWHGNQSINLFHQESYT
jgi:hypothetical protein